jgi:cytochrome c5
MIKRCNLLLSSVVVTLITTSAQAAPLTGYQSYNGVTNDVGPDLASVIEYDDTKAACDLYQADLDQYIIDNDAVLSQLSDVKPTLADLSDQEQYIIDNFVDSYDEATVLQCGKYLYFYGHFDTTGVPQDMFNWMMWYFEDYFGPGMTNFGMYEDPGAVATVAPPAANPGIGNRQLPVGLAASSGDFGGDIDRSNGAPVYSFTCSACHFKQMDDGNYAVGIGNTEFDYAKMTAAQGQVTNTAITPDQFPAESWAPDGLMATMQTVVADANAQHNTPERNHVQADLLPILLGLLDAAEGADLDSISQTPLERDRNWNSWSGVIDFLVRPMQDDLVHGMTRIMNTNAITTDEHVLKQHGFGQQQGLSWNGGAYNLVQFIRGFITITPSHPTTPEIRPEYNYWVKEYRYMPLVRYLETIDEPNLPTDRTFDTAAAKRGEAIFDDNCTSCHNGPGGETVRPYGHREVRVEETHANIYNPEWVSTGPGEDDGYWENGIDLVAERFPAGTTGEVTRKVKAPRFISMWDNNRLLHNGSVGGLEELLTCEINRTSYASVIPSEANPNPTMEEHLAEHAMFSNQGHEFGCHFSTEEKSDLITFIETFSTNRDVGNKYNGQFDTACQLRNNGAGSKVVNLTFTNGKRMDLKVKYFSDDSCQVFDNVVVNNPTIGLSWEMEVGSSFTNSRGFESHNVTYTKPDGTIAEDVIAIENGRLANGEAGDPVPTPLYARAKTDYPGLNGIWLNNECTDDSTRTMAVIQDGYRVEKLVTYNVFGCTGGVQSVVNTGSWSFEDPEWLRTGVLLQNSAKYNMRLRMKAMDGSGWTTQFVNRWGNNLSTMFNNYWLARINANGEHYTRVYNITTAE